MTLLASLRDLLRHMEWADAVVWRTVLGSAPAITDSIVKSRLHHTHMVQRAFFNIWREAPHSPNMGTDLNLEQLVVWGKEHHARVPDYLATLRETDLDRPIVMPWASALAERLGGEPHVPSLGETMLQIASHSTHHRGQVCARLRELGAEPPLTDFIAWIWFGKPPAEWPG
jgi:uncharacterized damage-inducible protein DinB